MLSRQGEMYINASGDAGSAGGSGWNGAVAIAPLKSIYIEAGGNFVPAGRNFAPPVIGSSQPDYTTKFGYGSVGLFKYFTPNFGIDGEIGYGKGTTETYDAPGDYIYGEGTKGYDHSTVAYDRFHIQGGFNFRTNTQGDEKADPWRTAIFEGAITERISFLYTTNYTIDHFDSSRTYLSSTPKNYSNTFLETGFTFRGGVEHLMLELQFGFSTVLENQAIIPYDGLILSVGIVSRF